MWTIAVGSLLAAAIAFVVTPDHGRVIARIELLVLGATLAAYFVGRLRRSVPLPPRSAFDRAPRARDLSLTPLELQRAELEVRLVVASATSIDRLLVPRLRAMASARLELGHGLDLRDPAHAGAVAALAGPHLWALIDPARIRADDPTKPGVALPELSRALTALEAL
ncbi:MAG: hypothetical protein ABJD24_06655 [Acidimicrobiales bacterium]